MICSCARLDDLQFFRTKYPARILAVRVKLAVRADRDPLGVGYVNYRSHLAFINPRSAFRGGWKDRTPMCAAQILEANSISNLKWHADYGLRT